MMVFLNDRILYGDRDDQAASEMVTGALGSIHFATAAGSVDTAQEQLAMEGPNGARGSMLGQTAIQDLSNKHSCLA